MKELKRTFDYLFQNAVLEKGESYAVTRDKGYLFLYINFYM